jgi:hypothetical protein
MHPWAGKSAIAPPGAWGLLRARRPNPIKGFVEPSHFLSSRQFQYRPRFYPRLAPYSPELSHALKNRDNKDRPDIELAFANWDLRYIIPIMEEIIEFVGYITGELLLFILTLGRRKPNWNCNKMGIMPKLLIQRSTWLGFIFWGAVFLLTTWLLALK